MDFGRRTETLVYTDASTYDYGIKQNVQTLHLGISYPLLNSLSGRHTAEYLVTLKAPASDR